MNEIQEALMDAEETLLWAIVADPSDDTTWLALADCLEEQEQPDRAELVRLREWLRQADLHDRQRPPRARRLQELLAAGVKPAVPMRQIVIAKKVTLDLVLIPPGSFWMGSPNNEAHRFGDEGPRHRVTLTKAFWLGVHPVTRAQWRAATGRQGPNRIKRKDHPVNNVSWHACQQMCASLGALTGQVFRLPTEAEWEYACRAATTTTFHSGDDLESLDRAAWYKRTSSDQTHPVGQKEPNAWGLFDMHGNILEWCQDGDRAYKDSSVTDPVCTDTRRPVTRGGAFASTHQACRCAFRYQRRPDEQDRITGCRVVLQVVESSPSSSAKQETQ
jgi:uncharacterized protein (TIGR02996 family)